MESILKNPKNNSNLAKDIRQAVRFGLVGILNTLVGFGTYALLLYVFHLDDRIANIISYIFGLTNSFIFNKLWTFKSRKSPWMEMFFFLVVFAIAFGLQYLVYAGIKEYLHWQPVFAYIAGNIVYTGIGFVGNKIITFRNH